MVAGDFTMYLKHWGANVVGSPFQGVSATGVTFVVEPGTYVVSQDPLFPGYVGSWSGTGVDNGFINLAAGQDITIIRTINDWSILSAAPVDQPATENGGTLPVTSAPWNNAFAGGFVLAAIGLIGLRRTLKLSK